MRGDGSIPVKEITGIFISSEFPEYIIETRRSGGEVFPSSTITTHGDLELGELGIVDETNM